VLFVGLDGADWQLLDGYMADGTMPNLAALARQGRGGVLTTIHPPLSPLVWTTMMTGVSPLEHRVLDFTELDPRSGRREPITSAARRAPAIWNMATLAGRSVAVFGLWATFPAEPVRGLLVADRFSSFTARDQQPPPGVVYPPVREPWALQILRDAAQQTAFEEIHGYLPWLARGEYERLLNQPEPYAHPVTALRQILVETRAYEELALQWLERARPDLAVVYFQGTDSIGHIFAPYSPPRQEAIPAADFARYGGVPKAYFARIDRLLGRFRALAERTGAVLFLASDHGFYWGEGRPAHFASAAAATAGRWHRDEGIYLLRGPGVDPAAGERSRGSVNQVCATLLALLGLPPGKNLYGPPLAGTPPSPPVPAANGGAASTVDYRAYYQPAAASPGPGGASSPAASGAPEPGAASGAPEPGARREDEKLAQLRALGYIGGAEPRRVRPASPGAAGASATRTAASFNNEGLLLRQLGRTPEAKAAFEQSLARDPGLASAQWNLSDLLFSALTPAAGSRGAAGGRLPAATSAALDRADDLLLRALAGGLPDGVERTAERAAAYGHSGAAARSLALLDRAVGARPAEPRLWLLRGRYRLEQQRCEPALADFTRAEQLAPTSPLAHASAGLAHLCRGDEAGALAEFRRSLDLDPNQPEIRRFLAPNPH
jgi:tetratricopeptide (TPR) repeat protein